MSAPLLFLVLLLSSILGQEPAPAAGTEVEDALLAGISEERAARVVRELVALGPRMGGTPSGERSATWLAERFRHLGLEVRVLEDPPTWSFQLDSFRFVAHPHPLEGEEEPPQPLLLDRSWPFAFSPPGRGQAPLSLEAGEGVAQLIDGRPRRRGDGPVPALLLTDGLTTTTGAFGLAVSLPAGVTNPCPALALSKPEGLRLRAWLAEGRRVEIEYALEARIAKRPPQSVLAVLPARPGAEAGYFLFCAHGDSDSGGPGANDNASGVAVVLEIASAVAAAVADGRLPGPPRELRFAIWGKEIHSTLDYARRRLSEEGPILGVCNFDQAGFGSGSEQLNVEPDDLEANHGLVGSFAGLLRERVGTPGFPPRWATNKSLGGTDSYVFSGNQHFQERRLPALTVFTSAWGRPGLHPRTPGMPGESWSDRDQVSIDHDEHYHSAGDLPENTTDREPYKLGWCARAALLAVWRWLEAGAR